MMLTCSMVCGFPKEKLKHIDESFANSLEGVQAKDCNCNKSLCVICNPATKEEIKMFLRLMIDQYRKMLLELDD